MNIQMDKAEEIAKAKLQEYFSEKGHGVTREIAARFGFSSMRRANAWVVSIDVYPQAIRPLDAKSKAVVDDRPETRAKTWINVFVDVESGAATIQEECELASLL